MVVHHIVPQLTAAAAQAAKQVTASAPPAPAAAPAPDDSARLAAEQGREVYAIPGSIHHPGAKGCHQLIRDGALLVETVEQILESLQGWQNLPPAVVDRFDHPLLALLHAAPQTSESLAHCSELPLADVLAQLTELELEGRVSNEAGRWFARAG